MTPSILGPAPVVDFDGTLTRLPVAWADLRAQLRVERIEQLWHAHDSDAWSIVRRAEVEAARHATPLASITVQLEQCSAFAVLTSNSEDAVALFLHRFPALESRLALVVGRETLGGPKHDSAVFQRGFAQCVSRTASARGDGPVVYVGDAGWELEYAQTLGAETIDTRRLNADC